MTNHIKTEIASSIITVCMAAAAIWLGLWLSEQVTEYQIAQVENAEIGHLVLATGGVLL